MPITLAEAARNTQDDFDATVIDEFRKESTIMDAMVFDDVVNPAGGGDTLDYSYRRQITQPTASTRKINTEYTASNVTTQKFSTSLAIMGGAFSIDRVTARLDAVNSGGVAVNMRQKIKATRTLFQDLVINGDLAVDDASFDGLDKALTGSTTEYSASAYTDWSDLDTDASVKFKGLDKLDEFLSLLDGTPTLLLGCDKLLAKIRAIVRRTGLYVKNPVDNLLGPDGRPIMRETYGGITFADPGEKAGSTSRIIPIETRNVGGSVTNLTDLYAVRIAIDGFTGITTMGNNLVNVYMPDFTTTGAVKSGEVELGPVGVALKATRAAAVWRNIKVA